MDSDKIEALKQVLVRDLGYSEEEASKAKEYLDKGDFEVMTPEETEKAERQYYRDLIDDIGLEAFSDDYVKDFILEDNIPRFIKNYDWFKKWCEDDFRNDYDNIDEDDREEELKNYNAKNKDEYVQNRINDLYDNYGNYPFHLYIRDMIYGVDDFNEKVINLIKDGTLQLDVNALVDELMLEHQTNDNFSILGDEEYEVLVNGKWYNVYTH